MKAYENRKSKRERSSHNRLWFRLRPAFLKQERRFYSERERRDYGDYVRRMHARASLVVPL